MTSTTRRAPRARQGGWLCCLATAVLCGTGALAQQQPPSDNPRALVVRPDAVVKGDLDVLIERRAIRVAAPFSRTLYFNDKGRERGISADFVRDFEGWLNRKYQKELGKRPVTVVIRPTTRDQLLKDVADGRADIAVGNLTATEERLKLVDFAVAQDMKPSSELVVTGAKSGPLASADELAGKTVHVRKTSSYYESLVALNERLKKENKRAVNLVLVPDALEDEDMMEMVNAGVLEVDRRRRLESQHVGAGAAQDQGQRRRGGAHRRQGRLGHAQGQPQADGCAQRVLHHATSRSRASTTSA